MTSKRATDWIVCIYATIMVSVGVYGKWVRGWGSVNLPSNHRNKHPPPPLATVISTLIYPVPHPPHQHTPLLQPLTPAVHQSHLTKAVFYYFFYHFTGCTRIAYVGKYMMLSFPWQHQPGLNPAFNALGGSGGDKEGGGGGWKAEKSFR